MLLARLIIYLVVIGTVTFLAHQEWNKKARVVFKEALLQELQKRDTVPIPHISDWKATSALEKVNPGSVELILGFGRKRYVIPTYKYENSIAKERVQRALLTALLDDFPLDADSLHETWSKLLKESDIPLKTYTRISVLDFDEQASSTFSKNVQKFSRADSLLSYYMGFRCEVEATGYTYYYWWGLFGGWRLLVLGIACGGVELLFFIVERIYRWRKLRQKEKVEEDTRPVVVVATEQPHLYQLEQNTFFDAERMELKKKKKITKFTPQTAVLLELFLLAENHKLSAEEISKELWPDGSGNQVRIYKLLHRLRQLLEELTTIQIECKRGTCYLIIPHFIERNALTDEKNRSFKN